MQTLNRHAFCFFLGLVSVGTAAAQPSEEEDLAQAYGDKSSVSIATGSKLPISKAPSAATVMTAEDIQAMGATDLDQVMETVPGVHVSRTAEHWDATYQIRGITGNPTNPQVLMLQNGIPMNTLYRGDKGEAWGGLPLENVARIEIIRGPGSALYGADAFSGVINIITKTATDTPGTEFGARAGSFNTWNTWAQHGGKWGAVDTAAYLNVGGTAGEKGIITQDAARLHGGGTLAPGPVNTGYDSIDANLDLGYDKWRLRTGYKQRDIKNGAGISSALDPVGHEKSERINADLSWDDLNFAQNWGLGFTGTYLYDSEDALYQLFPPGTTFPTQTVTNPAVAALLGIPVNTAAPSGTFPNGMIGNPSRKERHLTVSAYAAYTGFAGHSLRFGLGHDDLDMYETSTHKNYYLNANGVPVPTAFTDYSNIQTHILPHRRRVDNYYAQDEWNFARDWTLTAGVRRDMYSDFGGTTNPRLALVWDATLDLTAKLLYGEAFRAPSFNEQYGINPVAGGNPNLLPETIKTLEEAFTWQARKDTQVNLNFFHYEANNLIQTVANPITGTGATYQNTGKQHGSGMELEGVWDASRTMRLTGNYSYQKSISYATNQDSGYAPHNHIYLRGDWRFVGGWLSSVQINRVSDRMRAAGDTRPPVPDYTTLDLTARTTRDKIEYAASVRNLLNATVLEPSLGSTPVSRVLIPNDLPMAPRSVWLQASYKL